MMKIYHGHDVILKTVMKQILILWEQDVLDKTCIMYDLLFTKINHIVSPEIHFPFFFLIV